MATVIYSKTGSQRARTCNAICHDAKKPDCSCICGNNNHGKGLGQARENTKELEQKLFAEGRNVKRDNKGKLIIDLAQMRLL